MRRAYQTDLSDAEWSYIEPHLPIAKVPGRPRLHALREILDAIFYILPSGCAWRLLPHDLLISAEIAKRSLVVSLFMDNSLSKEATDWREGRRLRAFELKQQGWSQQRIAEALGVSKGAVSQWMKRARDGGGAEALKRRPAPGARPRLSEDERAKVPELLGRGAEAYGFRGDVWTCERVAIVIRREFGVGYHPAHVSRLLKALRQSLQKPQRRAGQRDEEAIERWKEERWPQLKKGRKRKAGP